MTRFPFQMVDVFGQSPFTGNPVAVVTATDDIDTDTMQRITRWFNLSETTFLLPPSDPGADYRVRIFTLDRELPFAGHPTLGTCHAWLAQGGQPRDPGQIVQQCAAGLIKVRQGDAILAFAAPPLQRSGPVDDALADEICAVLGIDRAAVVACEWVDNGPGWIGVQLASASAVLALTPRRAHHRRIEIGLVGLYPPGSPAAYEVRALFTDSANTLIEDPVTGSLNASVAQWMLARGQVTTPYVASQGTAIGRTGRIAVDQDAVGAIWIGGNTVTLVDGAATI